MQRPVDPFDLILFWPLEISPANGEWNRAEFQRKLTQFAGWKKLDDALLREDGEAQSDFAYAEWCDVHPHARRFLYGDGPVAPDGPPPLYDVFRLQSKQLQTLEVNEPNCRISFTIRDIRLHVDDGGLAFVIVDLTAAAPTDWSQALSAISTFRGIYPKYYKRDGDRTVPGEVFERVRILPLESSSPIEKLVESDHAAAQQDALRERRPRLARHWRKLLGALWELGARPDLLSDHRLSLMTWIGVEGVKGIERDDWMALTEADSLGFVNYAPEFRDAELTKAGYDRWWKELPAGQQPPDKDPFTHRYLVGAKVYASVRGLDAGPRPFNVSIQRQSWRRQYAHGYFAALYQRAFLLALQERIARAAAGSNDRETLLAEVERIERDMVLFSSRCWFTEVSAQIQPQQMYLKVREQLALEPLYEGVATDLTLLGSWVAAGEQRQRERHWNVINHWVVPAGLLLALLGADVIATPLRALWLGWARAVWLSAPARARSGLVESDRGFELLADIVLVIVLAVGVYWVWRVLAKLKRGEGRKR